MTSQTICNCSISCANILVNFAWSADLIFLTCMDYSLILGHLKFLDLLGYVAHFLNRRFSAQTRLFISPRHSSFRVIVIWGRNDHRIVLFALIASQFVVRTYRCWRYSLRRSCLILHHNTSVVSVARCWIRSFLHNEIVGFPLDLVGVLGARLVILVRQVWILLHAISTTDSLLMVMLLTRRRIWLQWNRICLGSEASLVEWNLAWFKKCSPI